MRQIDGLEKPTVVIIEENSSVPLDVRVWYEATSLRDAGWRVVVVCPDTSKTIKKCVESDLEGVKLFKFPLYFAQKGAGSYIWEYINALVAITQLCHRVWRKYKFQVMHICNPPDIFFMIAAFYRLLGVKVIFDHHDLFPELVKIHSNGLLGKVMYRIARVSEFLTMATANVILSTNASYRKIALTRGKKKSDSVFVVRNGPKSDQFTLVEPDLKLREGFAHMACYVGVMAEQDGVVELIDVLEHVVIKQGRKDILFILIGDGAMRIAVDEKVRRLRLDRYVRVVGFIRDKLLLRRYICTADICLAPEPLNPLNKFSTFIKVGEYMAMAKPVVAYDLIETRYTAQKAALYAPSGDISAYAKAVVTLIDSPEKRKTMGNFGKKRINELFCWEQQSQNLFKAYNAVYP